MADDAPEVESAEAEPVDSQPTLEAVAQEQQQPPEAPGPPAAGQAAGQAADESGQGLPTQLSDDEAQAEFDAARANEVAFSWQASEYVHHHKTTSWYLALFGGVVVLVAATALLHSWLEMAAILVMSAAIVVYARKPPRTLLYELTPQGVAIEGRHFPFEDFRSFGVLEDEEWHTVDLEPAKRLRPRMTMLFNSDDLDAIVEHLELHLPREDREPDAVERLTRYLRF